MESNLAQLEEQLAEDRVRRSRLRKWDRMSRKGVDSFLKSRPEDFWKRVRHGIPQEHRWNVWKSSLLLANAVPYCRERQEREAALFSGSPTACSCMASLLRRESSWHEEIQRDASRTFMDLPSFTEDHEDSLCRVLNAYAFLAPEVGYVEGMSFVAAVLLLVAQRSEAETLQVFVRLMEDCGLNGFYKNDRPLLNHFEGLFEQLMEDLLPELKCHFDKEGVESADYVNLWFLSLFAYNLPIETVLLVWDIIMCKGLPYLVLAAVALLSSVQEVLLSKYHQEILQFFRSMAQGEDEMGAEVGRCLTKQMSRFSNMEQVQSILGKRPEDSSEESTSADDKGKVRSFNLDPAKAAKKKEKALDSMTREEREMAKFWPKKRVSFSHVPQVCHVESFKNEKAASGERGSFLSWYMQ